MSGRRGVKAFIQLLYFVARAWLALTTPCTAQVGEGLASPQMELGGGAQGDQLSRATTPAAQKNFRRLSIRPPAARLKRGVAVGDPIT
jgi:hypothetical protein